MIELQSINKFFGNTQALANVSLFIQEGEIFGIIGRSGAGKSTLLRMINRLETPDSGHIIIDNQFITNADTKTLREVRHKMGMIFQHFNLLSNKTVFENIALPMRIQKFSEADIAVKIDELLNVVELTDKKSAYPSALSGGQKQRVAIARALASSPKILLCDEATSALDPETTESILALLQKINHLYGLTIVLITHEMDVVKRICHRVAVMEQGLCKEVIGLGSAFSQEGSIAGQMLFKALSPKLPVCLAQQLKPEPNHHPVVRMLFQGANATTPFISQTSRELNIDINILLANIDRIDDMTYGVMVIELLTDTAGLNRFLEKCQQCHLTVETLGYVHDTAL